MPITMQQCRAECEGFDTDICVNIPVIFNEKLYVDRRGYFSEVWNQERRYIPDRIFQINHSHSKKGVIRGMHWQAKPYAIGKYVTCLVGEIQDVVVDLRRRSKTYGCWKAYDLKSCKHNSTRDSLWVPEGFAHGFCTLSDMAEVMYMQNGVYNKDADRGFRPFDPNVGIEWAIHGSTISGKDAEAPLLSEIRNSEVF